MQLENFSSLSNSSTAFGCVQYKSYCALSPVAWLLAPSVEYTFADFLLIFLCVLCLRGVVGIVLLGLLVLILRLVGFNLLISNICLFRLLCLGKNTFVFVIFAIGSQLRAGLCGKDAIRLGLYKVVY